VSTRNSPGHRHGRLALLVAGLVGCSMFAANPVQAGARTPWYTNLVRNPGAEAGPASSNGYAQVVAPHWEFPSEFTVVRYGQTGGRFPTRAQGNRIGGLDQFFAAGPAVDPDCDPATQEIPLVGRSRAIDRRNVRVTVSAWVATAGPIQANIDLRFLDRQERSTGTALVVARVTGTRRTFVKVSRSAIVPAGSRQLLVQLSGDGATGRVYCDAFFDRVKVRIAPV
jgi:hypothetical protein